jgi:PAS domain-containing protein
MHSKAEGDPGATGFGELRIDSLVCELLGEISEGVAVFDSAGALVLNNPAFSALNPRIADLIVRGVAWAVLVREAVLRGAIPEEEGRRLESMEAQLSDFGQSTRMELHLVSGSIHEISLKYSSIGGSIITQRDITERKQFEMSDRQAEILLGKVLEACPAPVVMSRIGDGQVLYRSPAATELLGASRRYYDHFASREDRADFITALLPDGRVEKIQTTGLRPDGTTFPCSISARIIEYHGEDVMVSNTVDMSKEVALQKTLAEQREQIFQAEKMSALGELLAGASVPQDFRAPLK